MRNRIIFGNSFDPWYNLALEECLFERREEGVILYLWQNERTVVIGRNQNAWRECRAELLEQEGGRLARRSSGGGAVFHDLGNLNFTFLTPREAYDLPRQLSVIQKAIAQFGLASGLSGRNDLLLDSGEKFSGNAFRFTADRALHHGTVLVDADMELLGRYLSPSPLKLAAKGVSSVKSRVRNLHELAPELTVQRLQEALPRAFEAVYGDAEPLEVSELDPAVLEEKRRKYASWEWRFGQAPAFDASLHTRFDWGEVEILLRCENGTVTGARVFTDAMDAELSEKIEALLRGCPYRSSDICGRFRQLPGEIGAGLAAYTAENL